MGSRSDDAYWNDKYDQPPDCSLCEHGCDCDPDDEEWEDEEALITMMEIIDG